MPNHIIDLLSDDDDDDDDDDRNDTLSPVPIPTTSIQNKPQSGASTSKHVLKRVNPNAKIARRNPYERKKLKTDQVPVNNKNPANTVQSKVSVESRSTKKILQAGLVFGDEIPHDSSTEEVADYSGSSDEQQRPLSVEKYAQQQHLAMEQGGRGVLFHDESFPPHPSSIQGPKNQGKKITCNCRGSISAKLEYRSVKQGGANSNIFQPIYKCANNRCKFYRNAFQAERMHWYRLGSHTGHSIVQTAGFSANDLCQGRVGDCWFLSALAVVANRPDLIMRLFGNGKFTQPNEWGICQVSLFLDGYWKTVVVDNFFPCIVDSSDESQLQWAIDASIQATGTSFAFTNQGAPEFRSSKYDPSALPDECKDLLRDTESFLQQDISRKLALVGHPRPKVDMQVDPLHRMATSDDLAYSKAKTNQLWVPILEKAYAKSHGCYQAISGGHIAEAFLDLTGAPTLVYHFDRPDFNGRQFWADLMKFRRQKLPMGCATAQSQVGIIGMHAYSILDVVEIHNVSYSFFQETGVAHGNVSGFTEFDGTVRLLHIRNPHGKSEWKGDFSDHSDIWCKLLEHEGRQPWGQASSSSRGAASLERTMRNDGKFWIDYDSFLMGFTNVDVVLAFLGNHAKSFSTNFPPKKSNLRCSRAFEINLIDEQPGLPAQDTVEVYIMGIQKTRRGAGHGRADRKVSYKVCDMGILVGEVPHDERKNHSESGMNAFSTVQGQMFGFQRNGHMKVVLQRNKTNSLVVMPISFGHPAATDKETSFVVRFVADAPVMIRELEQVPRLDGAINQFCLCPTVYSPLSQQKKRVLLDQQGFRVTEVSCLAKGGGTVFLYLSIDSSRSSRLSFTMSEIKSISLQIEVRCRGMSCRSEEGILQHETLGKSKKFEAAWRRFEVCCRNEKESRLLAVVYQSGQDYEYGGTICQEIPTNPCQVSSDTIDAFMSESHAAMYTRRGIFNSVCTLKSPPSVVVPKTSVSRAAPLVDLTEDIQSESLPEMIAQTASRSGDHHRKEVPPSIEEKRRLAADAALRRLTSD